VWSGEEEGETVVHFDDGQVLADEEDDDCDATSDPAAEDDGD